MSFLSKENIELLWDVLLDEPIIKGISKTNQDIIYNAFYKNMFTFFEKEKYNNYDLITLNKKFLTQVLKALRHENVKEKHIYKVEDIHSERQSMFEKQLAQKKADFESSILVKKPPVPNFTERLEEDKIKGMDELIARTIAERNFDISPMNITNETEQWLRSQETTVKLKKPQDSVEEIREIKYIKIENEASNYNIDNEIVELTKESKKISWREENEVRYIEEYNEPNLKINNGFNILNKLKKIDDINENENKILLLEDKLMLMEKHMEDFSKQLEKVLEMVNNNNLK